MGQFEHAGTSKTMPAIQKDPARTGDEAAAVAGEITAETTARTEGPGPADAVADHRGMLPIPRPSDR